jgi:hypothetical protein
MLTRTAAALAATCAFIGQAHAAPRACLTIGSDRAPQWAVELQNNKFAADGRSHGLLPPFDHIEANNPGWQHAICDKGRHTVKWQRAGEKETFACVDPVLGHVSNVCFGEQY